MNLERMFSRDVVCLVVFAFAFSAGAAETRINAIGEKSREEIVAFFADNEFGRRPAEAEKPPLLKFEKVSGDKLMPDGKMVRHQARVVYGGSFGTNSFPVTAFVPAGAKGPVPRFSLSATGSMTRTAIRSARRRATSFLSRKS